MASKINSNYLPIMEYVFEHRIPICWLVNKDMLRLTLNTDFHGFSRSEVLDILLLLLEEGLIYISDYDEHPIPNDAAAIEMYFNQAVIPTDDTAWYELTLKGGAFWEQASAFDWNSFYDSSYGTPEDLTGEIISSSEAYTQQLLLRMPSFNLFPANLAWSILAPWQATYWKELPIGYRVSFSYTVKETEEEDEET